MPAKCGQTITLNDDVFEHSETGWWCNAQRGDLAKVTKRTENGWLFVRPLNKPTIGFWVRNSPSQTEERDPDVVKAAAVGKTVEEFKAEREVALPPCPYRNDKLTNGRPICSCSYCSGNGHPQTEGCRWPVKTLPPAAPSAFAGRPHASKRAPCTYRMRPEANPYMSSHNPAYIAQIESNLAYEVAENRRLKKQLADALAAKDRAEHACDRLNKKGAELTDAHNELVEWVNEATSLAQACYMVGVEGEVRKLLKFVRKE